MRIEHYPIEQLKKELLDIIGRHLDLTKYRVFFFGSRVSGKSTDRSDDVVDFRRVAPIFREVALQHTEEITFAL